MFMRVNIDNVWTDVRFPQMKEYAGTSLGYYPYPKQAIGTTYDG